MKLQAEAVGKQISLWVCKWHLAVIVKLYRSMGMVSSMWPWDCGVQLRDWSLRLASSMLPQEILEPLRLVLRLFLVHHLHC